MTKHKYLGEKPKSFRINPKNLFGWFMTKVFSDTTQFFSWQNTQISFNKSPKYVLTEHSNLFFRMKFDQFCDETEKLNNFSSVGTRARPPDRTETTAIEV